MLRALGGRLASFLVIVSLAALVAGAPSAFAAGRVALIIGNSTYENLSTLSNPVMDAARMAEMLADNGFDVMSCDGQAAGCFDLDRGGMLDALEDFRGRADGATVALVFYAGHGMQTADGNVIAPVDIDVSCEDWRARRAVLLDDVLEAMAGAEEKIVIIDACRNDPFKAQQCLSRGARPLSFGSIAVPSSASRFLLMTSTQNGQVALDGPAGGHSPFAQALFHYMEAEPQRRFDQLLDLVTKRVVERTAAANFTQVPEILIRGGAPDACLAGNCGTHSVSTALRAEIDELKAKNARNQEYEEIVVALLANAGYGDLDTIPPEERQRFFDGIMAAGRALSARGERGEVALAALRTGDSGTAEAIFESDLQEAKESATEQRARAAQSARHLAAIARPKDTGKAARYFAEAAELDPANAQNWIDLAETSLATGNHAAAAEAYEKAVELARKGDVPAEQRVWAYEGYADIVWSEGRPQEAATFYREAADAARTALLAHPFNTGLKRGLIVTHYNIGHLQMDEGRFDEALSNFGAGLDLARELAREDPANPVWRFDAGRGYERIGRARQAMGQNDLAAQAYRTKHDIMTAVVASDPSNPVWVRDLSLADEFLGDIALADGDEDAAVTRYEASLARMIPLRDGDPSNTDHQRFTSVTHLKAGDVLEQTGDLDRAQEHFRAGMEISRKLVGISPENSRWRWDLFRAYQRMASSTPSAAEWHERALQVIEGMEADGVLAANDRRWIDITRERLAASRSVGSK